MLLNIMTYKSVINFGFFRRNIHTGLFLYKSHYDSLEITPKATQADIKSAYYKLSKIHHPDKNQGCAEASRRFQEVSNAYEVLGNYKLRKLYDKGLLQSAGDYHQPVPEEPPHPQAKFYQSRQSRHTYTGKTPIYDFDEWSRVHYEDTFMRRQRAKQRFEMKQRQMRTDENDIKTEKVIYTLLVSTLLFVFFSNLNSDKYDEVKKPK